MNKDSKIYIAGHRGLVGSAIVSNLKAKGYTNIIGKTHIELDLLDQQAVAAFFENEKPEYVFLAAAKVGGIVANNTYRADFIYENLQIQNNIIHQSYKNGVKKLMFLGSTCIYPKNAPQPMPEDCLLTDTLEYTNEPYAIAKIAGIKMCESYNLQYGTNYISVMPTNLYGPNDNFDLEKSHVLPALIRKIHCAKLLNEGRDEEVIKDLGVRTIVPMPPDPTIESPFILLICMGSLVRKCCTTQGLYTVVCSVVAPGNVVAFASRSQLQPPPTVVPAGRKGRQFVSPSLTLLWILQSRFTVPSPGTSW